MDNQTQTHKNTTISKEHTIHTKEQVTTGTVNLHQDAKFNHTPVQQNPTEDNKQNNDKQVT